MLLSGGGLVMAAEAKAWAWAWAPESRMSCLQNNAGAGRLTEHPAPIHPQRRVKEILKDAEEKRLVPIPATDL